MSEIKGIDQIFPKKTAEDSSKHNIKLWIAAGVVAALAAGVAVFPGSGHKSETVVTPPPAARMAAAEAPLPVVPSQPAANAGPAQKQKPVEAAAIIPAAPVKPQRRAEPRVDLAAVAAAPAAAEPKTKAPAKSHGCECETAELTLPAVCPDGACRQCKITCGIPGN